MSLVTKRVVPVSWSLATLLTASAITGTFTTSAIAQAPAAKTTVASEDGTLAIVNDEPITRRQVAQAAMRRYGSETLQKMIDRYLILQETKKAGVEITKEDVQNEILRTAKKWSLTPESYLRLLNEERNIAPEEYSSDVVWPMLAQRALVANSVTITQEEFNQAFIAEYGEAVKCRVIMMSDRDKLAKVREQALADPNRFGQLAAEHSEDPVSASVRGLVPPIRHHMGDPAFETLAFSLEENEISELYSVGDQWVVLQCVSRLAATPPNEQVFPKIREQIVDRLRDEKVRVEATSLLSKIREQSQIITVLNDAEQAKQYPGIAAIINNQKLTVSLLNTELVKRHGDEILDGEINRRLLTQALRKTGKSVTEADIDAEVASGNWVRVCESRRDCRRGWLFSRSDRRCRCGNNRSVSRRCRLAQRRTKETNSTHSSQRRRYQARV